MRARHHPRCGVPSERIHLVRFIPGVAPRAGMHTAPLGRCFVPKGHRIPAQSNALGIRRHPSPRSEGTQHTVGCATRVRPMRRSFRTHPFCHGKSQGFTLGWDAWLRWSRQSVALPLDLPRRVCHTRLRCSRQRWWHERGHPVAPQGQCIPAQSNALGLQRPRSPRSEGTPHIPDWRTCAQSTPMRRSFRTHPFCHGKTQGFTLRWYALPRWGMKRTDLLCRNLSPTSSSI
jgi:hypothetical protein